MKKKWRSSGRKRKSKKKKKKEEERNKKEKVRSIFKYARPPPPNLCLATNISKSLILLLLSPLRSVRKDDDSFYQAAAQQIITWSERGFWDPKGSEREVEHGSRRDKAEPGAEIYSKIQIVYQKQRAARRCVHVDRERGAKGERGGRGGEIEEPFVEGKEDWKEDSPWPSVDPDER